MHEFWGLSGLDGARTALISKTGTVTYEALEARVQTAEARLDQGRGIILLEMTPRVETIAMYLAALRRGCPVLPSGPAEAGLPVLYRYSAEVDVLETDLAAKDVDLHPSLRLLLSTSGSTGAQKYVRLSGKNIASNADAIAEYLSLTKDDRAPTALPLSYSYGLSVLNSHLAVGASLVLTEDTVISETFWTRFAETECTSFAGVPQSFTLLMKGGQLDRDYPALRYVTQAGGKLGPEAVRAMAMLGRAHGWDFYVMYGQTEASPRIAYLPPEKALSHPESIGHAIPGGTLTVERDTGPVPDGEEGELVYSGPNVMMGYAAEAADLALGQGESRLKTGDLGYRTNDGLFVITGRASRFLKLSGKRVSLDEIEAWAAREGTPVIATGEDDALGLLHTGEDGGLARRTALFLDIPQSFVTAIPLDSLPLNQNGKPDIKAAKAIFETYRAQTQPVADKAGGTAEPRVIAMFRRQFPGAEITPRTSFDKLGGTSADFVDVELALEEIGLDLPENWQTYTIADLAARQKTEVASYAPDYGSARIVCTILVVFYHVVGINEKSGLGLPDNSFWHAFNDFLDPLRMPMFAFLAGFSFWTMRTAENTPSQFASTLFRQLLIPTMVAIVAFVFVSNVISTPFAVRTSQAALELLYLPYAHFWFIMALTVILTGAYTLFRYAPHPLAVFAALAVLLVFFRFRVQPDIWAVSNAMSLTPMFALGYFYSRHSRWVLERRIVIWALAGLVIVAATLLIPDDPLPVTARRVIWIAIGLSMITLCLGLARHIPGLKLLAPYAFFIYLWHIFGTSGMRRAMEMIGVDAIPVQLIAGLLAGVFLPILLYHVLAYIPGGRWVRGK